MRILEGEVRNQLGDSEAGLAEIEAVVREIVAARGSKDPVSLLARNAWLNSLVDAGQLERGEQELRTLIADVQGDHSGVISALGLRENLANALVARGKPEEAIAIAEPLYAEESRLYGAAGQSTISVGNTLAVAYDNSNHMDKAEALYRELIANGQRTLGTDSGRVLGTMANLAVHYQIQQRWADSVALERQALAVYERKGEGATRPALLSRRSIARSLQNMGQWDESARDIRETIALASKHLAADDVLQSILAVDLAALALHAGNRAEAVRLLAAATPKILKEMGPDHAVSQRVMKLREQAGMPPPTPGG
jgi:non-specific serine/threonine protein kinase